MPNSTLTYILGGAGERWRGLVRTRHEQLRSALLVAYAPESRYLLGQALRQRQRDSRRRGACCTTATAATWWSTSTRPARRVLPHGHPALNTDFTTRLPLYRICTARCPRLLAAGSRLHRRRSSAASLRIQAFSSDLVAPYSFLLNLSYARPIAERDDRRGRATSDVWRTKACCSSDSFQAADANSRTTSPDRRGRRNGSVARPLRVGNHVRLKFGRILRLIATFRSSRTCSREPPA